MASQQVVARPASQTDQNIVRVTILASRQALGTSGVGFSQGVPVLTSPTGISIDAASQAVLDIAIDALT